MSTPSRLPAFVPGLVRGVLVALGLGMALGGCLNEYSLTPVEDTHGEDCAPEDELCGEECVSLFDDSNNCGDCGLVCLGNTECVDGECERTCEMGCDPFTEECNEDGLCECRAGAIRCNGLCVDERNDINHCGECFHTCESGEVCGGGECFTGGCMDFEADCGDHCSDLSSDPFHCGACGNPCRSNELCVAGECVEYWPLDPDLCLSCPCITDCDPIEERCCFSDFLDADVCLLHDACPE